MSGEMKRAIIAAHQANPGWTTSDIRRALGCSQQHVGMVALRCDLPIPFGKGGNPTGAWRGGKIKPRARRWNVSSGLLSAGV